MKICITNGTFYTGDDTIRNAHLLVNNGLIEGFCNEVPSDVSVYDLAGKHVSAGFIDIHINGGEQFFFTQQPTTDTIDDIVVSSLQYATTHVMPCLISAGIDTILQAIDAVKTAMQQHPAVLGMHLEGPFLHPLKRGAHAASLIQPPTDALLMQIIAAGNDVIRVMTIAPEMFTDYQIAMLMEAGIRLSAGHTTLTCTQANYYFSKGIRLVTHLYNAMTQFGHREPGLVGAVFEAPEVFAPIILDGQHCDYVAARTAHRLKQDKLFLISDAAFLSKKIKQFQWGEFNMQLTADGHYRNTEGNLACSSISMADAVRNAKEQLYLSTKEAIAMATSIPAKAIGMADKIGFIRPGYPARFACFDEDFGSIQPLVFAGANSHSTSPNEK